MSDESAVEVDRTDLCEECGREIVPDLERVEGQHELIHEARTAEEGFMSVVAGKAIIRYTCACSSVEVEFGPGSASAWDFPDSWMWADNYEPEEVPRLAE